LITLYDARFSGNCYKVRLLLAHLDLPYERIAIDLKKGEARTGAFRARFPLGRVPVAEIDGEVLAESNAILWYLAEGTPFIPTGKLERARALQWMFWEQYSHEPYVAVVRAWRSFYGIPPGKEAELQERESKGYAALDTMERHLKVQPWFAGGAYGVADIALYAYTHVAPEGGFDLGRYPTIRDWMARVAGQPRHVSIGA
jgi:glutathione S-transferase